MPPTFTAVLLAAAALQQPTSPTSRVADTLAVPGRATSRTSPAGGDTTGYWQQRADYQVVATLDETRGAVRARGRLTYVNQSPDTLRELYLHQYLNAFRPGSRWSAVDEREGRLRFQRLSEPAYGYERFTATPLVSGVAVRAAYPLAPDSTVVRLALPRALAPRDSVAVDMEWEARPSTTVRRQGRRGRTYDLAHWYPKVAVYDRGGWQAHPLVPSGEFYGEFGAFDVTLVVRDDQVIGATGVPVDGDPGWARASSGAAPRTASRAYGAATPPPAADVPPGFRRVRFLARGVHQFAWAASPEFRYDGGTYVRDARAPGGRFPVWDTVSVHVLFKPGEDSTWGGGRVVQRTVAALGWLERTFGTYGYPQLTVVRRLDTGGTEFPMIVMNATPSQGLILHEGGHVFAYGLLANNEWNAGWMDEGLTTYQTAWAAGEARHELALRPFAPAVGPAPTDSAVRRRRVVLDSTTRMLAEWARTGRAEPVGRPGAAFSNATIYSSMTYTRASQMYGALRDVIGDEAFAAFLRDYYARWAFRHVDEAAMRASAERAARRPLGWFFDQWLRRVGTVDYALRDVRWVQDGARWVTRGTLVRTGSYRHPMPVGVLTAAGWTVVRGDAARDRDAIVIRTATRPLEVRLDPYGTTEAWTARWYAFPRERRDLTAQSTGRAELPRAGGGAAP